MIYNASSIARAADQQIDAIDYYVKEVSSGYDELIFETSVRSPAAQILCEEQPMIERSDAARANRYLIKSIDHGKATVTVKCQVDLDAWKQDFYTSFMPTPPAGSSRVTPQNIVLQIMPTGWSLFPVSIPAFGTLPPEVVAMENVTPLDILDNLRELYPGLTYRFFAIEKMIQLTRPESGQDTGAFVSLDQNLRATYYKGKSTSLITRLYAEGRDGLTFASINDGKPYVDSTAYKDGAIISGYWKATEYTDASDLLAATQARLALLSVPERSFDIDVAVTDILQQYPLFSVVRISDDTIPPPMYRDVTIRVAERWIHPDHPQSNKIILSTAPARIQSQVASLIKAMGG